jgi:hypothetical protein
VYCQLKVFASSDDRILKAGTLLTIIDRLDPSVTQDEKKALGQASSYFSPAIEAPILTTPGGTHVGLVCRAYTRWTKYENGKTTSNWDSEDALFGKSAPVTIAELKQFASVTIAIAPVIPIP